jgi:poly(A) polymerase
MSEAPARIEDGFLVGAAFAADRDVREIFELLDRNGEEVRIVGGAPRDALLGAPVREIDFATTALPGVVTARAQAAGLKTVPTGVEHGTVTLVLHGKPYEITTLREDIATDGRRAVVRFGRSFEHDASRRDFTVNALSVSSDGRLHDYVGGLADLARRRVCFIGDAATRIREDYLRSLRFLRFCAQFGEGAPDVEALAAILANRDGLARLSRERVRSELMKLLLGRRSVEICRLMSDIGLMASLLGGVVYCERLPRFLELEDALESPPDVVARLAALTTVVFEDGERLRDRLRLSNADRDRLVQAGRLLPALHGRDAPPEREEMLELLFHWGRRACADALFLACAEAGDLANRAAWIAALRALPALTEPKLPFGGADVVARGVAPGQGVGVVLKDLQARWIRAGFPKDAGTISRLLDEATETVRNARKP